MYVRVTGDRVETCPISGTIRRGADPLEDAANIRTLLNSAKEESELTMCTDVDRNDKSRICVPGSVRVIGRRQIEMYSRLIHTVDHVEGRLRPGLDALDAFLTHMWAVTVTGAPKTWAMQFIEDHERAPRRWYGGAVGMIGFDGGMNTGLTLRTAHIRNGVAAVRAGATLLFDSDPLAEERETELKARALLETLADGPAAAAGGTAAAARTDAPAAPGAGAAPRPGDGLRVLLVDHQDSFVHTLAGYFREQGADGADPAGRPAADRPWTSSLRTWWCCRRGRAARPTSPARSCWTSWTCAGCPRSGCAWACRPWSSTRAASWRCSASPSTASPAPSCGCRRTGPTPACWLACRREFTAARYHSLHAAPEQVKGGFTVTAVTADQVVMAIEDPAAGRWAVQFHPESILTAAGSVGHQVVANVLRLCRARAARQPA